MLILVTVVLIIASSFCSRWEEFACALGGCIVLSILGRAGWKFWGRYLKLSFALVLLSVFFNWFMNYRQGVQALWPALGIGGRFALALFLSLLLVHVCTHDELVWGLARLSEKLFRSPITGEILALSLLSVPFFLDSLSKVRRWKDLPGSVASVFRESQLISSHPVEISGKRPGWVLFSLSAISLVAAVIVR
jgi:energy-coupling factor transporter transmembrane protein EcfT